MSINIKKEDAEKTGTFNKNRLEQTREDPTDDRYGSGQVVEDNIVTYTDAKMTLDQKTQIVDAASTDLEQKKSELEKTNANIDKIRKMMQKK